MYIVNITSIKLDSDILMHVVSCVNLLAISSYDI